MNGAGEDAPDPFADALLAARLCARDQGLVGIVLRGGGELRDAVIATLRAELPPGAPLRRVPAHIDDERLLGGLDLTATLARGTAVTQAGLLAEAAGGVLVLPMAERLSDATAGRIAAALDGGARFVVIALDDGVEDERVPAALAERLAFRVELSDYHHPGLVPESTVPPSRPALVEAWSPAQGRGDEGVVASHTPSARAEPVEARTTNTTAPNTSFDRLRTNGGEGVVASSEVLHALASTAAVLGIDSARGGLFALRVASAAAALAGRADIADADVALAARLVLGPRATRLPTPPGQSASAEPPPPPPDPGDGAEERGEPGPLEDIVLAAALAALPRDVLAQIAAGRGRQAARTSGAGERRKSAARGRPLGARAGLPGGGRRLSLIDTLRAAAPWQKLRGRTGSVQIRRDDLRIRRFETRAPALTIFAVDASGSSALARLAEAKGAVELLLAEAYVKRAEVALVAFRGAGAEVLLPPTRSLVRARRALGELPGGGGTPLAAGLTAARELAESGRSRGRTPFLVVLTDGRANIAHDGSARLAAAQAEAEAAARAIGAAGIAAAFVDISARPRAEGAALAAAMGARYLPLPRADAAAMHAAVGAVRPE